MSSRNSLWQTGTDLSALLLQTLRTWPWFETLRTLRLRFREDRLGITASSLTFTTLIAMVPLVTVMLALFSAFPMFADFRDALQKYFLQSLVPDDIAKPVLGALTQFAAKANRLGTAGLVLLLCLGNLIACLQHQLFALLPGLVSQFRHMAFGFLADGGTVDQLLPFPFPRGDDLLALLAGLVDEFLHGCGEQIKGVMQRHITPPNHPEDAFKILILQRAIFELAALGGAQF